jgi:sulfoxide reductase heme-binding subunit YedZ
VTRTKWIALAVIALVAEAVCVRLGLFADPIPKLAGTAAWTTSRAAGVISFSALTLDVMFGLFVSTGLLDRWVPRGASVDVHRWLSSVALGLVAAHSLALLADATIHFDALDTLVPGFSAYRPGAVALGTIALYGMIVIHVSFDWRKRIGVRAWRALHFTAFAVFALGAIHGALAGSDSSRSGMRAVYLGSVAIVTLLVVVRIALAITSRRRSQRPQPDRRADRAAPTASPSAARPR